MTKVLGHLDVAGTAATSEAHDVAAPVPDGLGAPVASPAETPNAPATHLLAASTRPAPPSEEVARRSTHVGRALARLADLPGVMPAQGAPRSPRDFAASLPLRPLLDVPLPDPGAVKQGELYTMVGTSNESADTFPIFQSPHRDGPWTRVSDTMGKPLSVFSAMERPAWISTTAPDRWAPELHAVDGKWLCVYTARHVDGDLRVAVAVADEVTGPFCDQGPILTAPHGVIDATVARDRKSGQWTMVYKLDDNAVKKPTPIIARPFAVDAGAVVWRGAPHEICRSGEGHGGLLEGPWLVHENGTSWITLSSDYYGGAEYKTWIGKIDDLLAGKVEDLEKLLTSDSPCLQGKWKGPGHNSLVREAPGVYAMYFHAWPAGIEDTATWETRFDSGEGRKVLRVTLAFIDDHGNPCPPYIVEDRLA